MESEFDGRVEFVRGPWDGTAVDTRGPEPERIRAAFFGYVTRGGARVGQVVDSLSPTAIGEVMREGAGAGGRAVHRYRVAGRREEGGRVVIRMEYVDEAATRRVG